MSGARYQPGCNYCSGSLGERISSGFVKGNCAICKTCGDVITHGVSRLRSVGFSQTQRTILEVAVRECQLSLVRRQINAQMPLNRLLTLLDFVESPAIR